MSKPALLLSALALSLSLCSAQTFASIDGMKPKPVAGAPLGYIIHNPYENAPLTALVTLAGHTISGVEVTVHANDADGVSLTYQVDDMRVMDEGGVPIFGLYPAFMNKFTVKWIENGERKSHDYQMLTPDIDMGFSESQWAKAPIVEVEHVDADFKDRLYFVNWTNADGKAAPLMHNNSDAPGAFSWDGKPGFFIIDTAGDIRWYMNPYTTHDAKTYDNAGYAMGMNVTKDGNMVWVQGQGWKKMSIMGRMISEHNLPGNFIDASHEGIEGANGNVFIRAAAKDYRTADGRLVNTVRDQIIEVDNTGKLVDYWDLNTILDPMRDAALLSLDAGAVCLNINLDDAGHQTTEEDLAKAPYGDIHGVATGRNWAHVNSIEYDPTDDSIILSSRHQSAVFKIGRDKQVKWILSASKGWSDKFQDKLLKPITADGEPIWCNEKGACQDKGFDFSWTSHTAYLVPEKGTLTVFDNGDGRDLGQPMFANEKYSRSVEYKIDEQNMTVQQVWEYGKDELGYEGYSPVTSIVKYQADKDSMMSYFASAGLFGLGGGYGNLKMDDTTGKVQSILVEHRYGETKPAVRINIDSHDMFATGYRAQVIRVNEMLK
ncbi:arylsulfate sulfotransferase AssT [Shewanella sairae]|uniref:Arylsulfate sulfotransferase AssT n=1 Tax=Shewanella sairae TaxID=190310 RepID=A0ABQ4PN39_9GAMM|nr:aryl-sulfate sulfotransferase [Shewanella sairae]MCL1130229.1 aryl-sulfate sulfotransferase [Shewanella sairae]GIU49667.1 arylsulfate sulfotransferase AssT [Shewanella sairae]